MATAKGPRFCGHGFEAADAFLPQETFMETELRRAPHRPAPNHGLSCRLA